MQLRLQASEVEKRGFPPLAIALEHRGLTPVLFPDPQTLVSLQGTIEGLPCVHLRVVKNAPNPQELVRLRSGAELVAWGRVPGESGEVEILGSRRVAATFYGRAHLGRSVAVAGCLATIPIEGDTSLLVIMGVLGTPKTRATPAAVASSPLIADVLASLELDSALERANAAS
jgi:hypothetical protein